MRRLPPPPLLGDVVRTTLFIWVALHVAFAIGAQSPRAVSPPITATLLALVVLIAHLDRKSRGLSLLLANLGFSPRGVALVVLGVAGTAEAVLQAFFRLAM